MSWNRSRAYGSSAAVLLIALCVNGCAPGVNGNSGSAACAAPTIELQESSLHPGGVAQFSVDGLIEDCEDTGGGLSPAASDTIISITPTADGNRVLLGRSKPEPPSATVSGSFDLPTDLAVGPALLAVEGGLGAELLVTITSEPPA